MTESTHRPQPMDQVASGIAGLDMVLRGGFLRGGIYVFMGQPGAGKTILANQISFNHVASGGRVVYVTLLAETHARMLAHLRPLRFFDPAPIGTDLYYVSAYQVLEEEGLQGLLELLRGMIRDHHATLLVIDGMAVVASVTDSDLPFKRFIHDLQVYIEASACTTFLLTHYGTTVDSYPEHTMVDGLVVLSDHRSDLRATRELEIRKLRGSNYLRGGHFFEITNEGVVVYPRTEVLLNAPQAPALSAKAAPRAHEPFELSALDTMFNGGPLAGSTTMLLGAPGSGKTLMGLHFLAAGARLGQNTLYFGFYEPPSHLLDKAEAAGIHLGNHIEQGLVEILWQPPAEEILDALASRLLAAVSRCKVRRVFIDGLAGFQDAAVYPKRINIFLTALTNELRAREVTTLFSVEVPSLFRSELEMPTNGVSTLVENLLFLRYVQIRAQLYRVLSLIKVRGSRHDLSTHEFAITDQGIEVAATAESADLILSGIGRPLAATEDARLPDTAPSQE